MKQRVKNIGGIIFLTMLLTVSGFAAEVKGLEFQKVDGRLEVLIKITGDFGYDTFELSSPNRLVVDVSPVTGISADPTVTINDNGVTTVRIARFKSDVARVVFDLADNAPSHRISKTDAGLKIVFWMEQPGQTITPPVEAKEEPVPQKPVIAKPEPPPAPKPVEKPAKKAKPRVESYGGSGESKYFAQIRGGLGIFPKPDNGAQKDFTLYGETATLKENYALKACLTLDANVGKYFMWKSTKMKGGIGLTIWSFDYESTYDFTLPHPFLENTPRTASFKEDMSNTIVNFYVYGLFNLVNTEKLRLWAGPAIGFSTGTFTSLLDYEIEEKSPYSGADITLTSTTPVEDTVSGLTFSGLINFEYFLSPKLSLIANGDLHYFNPTIDNLGKRLNFIVAQLTVGLQYNF